MASLLDQLYKTKLRVAGLATALLGVLLIVASHALAPTSPVNRVLGGAADELGAFLAGVGLLSIVFEFYARNEATLRLRAAVRAEAPTIARAVYDSLAFSSDALKTLSSSTVDTLIEHGLAVRLDDDQLAHDAYTDLRHQVVRAPERHHDARVAVSLSPWTAGPASGRGSMFVVTVRWEYRVRLTQAQRRFVCVADQELYRQLVDRADTAVWHFEPVDQLTAASPEAFELVQFTVDGQPLTIQRTSSDADQTYTVDVGSERLGRTVKISHTYRVLVQRHGHHLYLDVAQPTRGLTVDLSYAGAGIRRVTALDFIASSARPRTVRSPKAVPTPSITIAFDGWVFPKSGVVFVWVLEAELKGRPKSSDLAVLSARRQQRLKS